MLIQYIWDILSGDNLTFVYSIESIIPACDKPYHMNNGFQQMWAVIKKLWNYTKNYK